MKKLFSTLFVMSLLLTSTVITTEPTTEPSDDEPRMVCHTTRDGEVKCVNVPRQG